MHVLNDYDSVLETVFKTEFLTLLSTKYEAAMHRKLTVDICNKSVVTYISFLFNSFVPNPPTLYPLKTSKNRKLHWEILGKNGCIGEKWVNSIPTSKYTFKERNKKVVKFNSKVPEQCRLTSLCCHSCELWKHL